MEISNEARTFLQSGQKLKAIMVMREKDGLGLKEAKELIEAHIEAHPGAYPALNMRKMNGAGFFFLLIVVGGVCYFLFK